MIELSNIISLLLVVALPFALANRSTRRVPPIIALWFVSVASVYVAAMLHGGAGSSVSQRSLFSLVGTFTIVLYGLPNDTDRFIKMVVTSFIAFLMVVWISGRLAGVDVFVSVLNYLTSFNRNEFVFSFLRVMFNAFSTSGDATYVASVVNTLAATFAIFFLISASLATAGSRLMIAIAIISGGSVFILFSSSAVLSCALGGSAIFMCWLANSRRAYQPLTLLGLGAISMSAVWGPVSAFFLSNVAEDGDSRSDRVDQLIFSLEYINEAVLLGHGHRLVYGHEIHNWPLFAWVSGGILCGTIAIFSILYTVILCASGLLRAFREPDRMHWHLIYGTVPIIFLVRVMVGGGGGAPAGPIVIGLAIAATIHLRQSPNTGTTQPSAYS